MMEGKEKELRNALDCGLCLDILAMPVTTPCGHNFCKSCFGSLSKNSRLYRCPLCRLQLPRLTPEVNLMLDRVISVLYPNDYNQRISSFNSSEKKVAQIGSGIRLNKSVFYVICISIPVIAGIIICRRYNLPAWILSKLTKTINFSTCTRIWKTLLAIGYLLSCFVEVSSDIY